MSELFIVRAKAIHGDKYDYSKVNYINMNTKIIITCPKHGNFLQIPKSHYKGHGRRKCANNNLSIIKTSNNEEFIKKAIQKHNNKYDYSKVNYINMNTKIIITCPKHGNFLQSPWCHIKIGCGCQKCNYCGYSKVQILWLNFIAIYNNIYIQHAENDGEYNIPTTKYRADGYCRETNTIYEYHGSYWHGDPNIYDKNEINKVNGKTFGELYSNTQKKNNS
jgi:hypothetical protein